MSKFAVIIVLILCGFISPGISLIVQSFVYNFPITYSWDEMDSIDIIIFLACKIFAKFFG